MVVFDATFLLLLVDPGAAPPIDPSTNSPIDKTRERIEHLLQELQDSGERIIIPTPALSEALVGATGRIDELIAVLTSSYKLKTAPFDELAAIEVAVMTDKENARSSGLSTETKAKVKYDRQIIAIAKVNQADAIYSDDSQLRKKTLENGMRAHGLVDLPLPPMKDQGDWLAQSETKEGAPPVAD